MEAVTISSSIKHGPCLHSKRDCRRSCGGVPMYANTDVKAVGLAVPPPPRLGDM